LASTIVGFFALFSCKLLLGLSPFILGIASGLRRCFGNVGAIRGEVALLTPSHDLARKNSRSRRAAARGARRDTGQRRRNAAEGGPEYANRARDSLERVRHVVVVGELVRQHATKGVAGRKVHERLFGTLDELDHLLFESEQENPVLA